MIYSVILVSTLVVAGALPGNEFRSQNRPEGRITNGMDAVQKQFPYQVYLDLSDNNTETYSCCASLLSNTWVLTAAHCVINITETEVLLGTTDLSQPEIQYTVTADQFIVHKDYDSEADLHDICLIKIPYTNYTDKIQPVKLPALNATYSNYYGATVAVAGWGDTANSTLSQSKLQWAYLNIISNQACRQHFTIYPTNICTATNNGINICDGDSGGPMVLKSSNVQIGIISYGYNDCLHDTPAVYTRLTSYLDWIKEITGIFY